MRSIIDESKGEKKRKAEKIETDATPAAKKETETQEDDGFAKALEAFKNEPVPLGPELEGEDLYARVAETIALLESLTDKEGDARFIENIARAQAMVDSSEQEDLTLTLN